MLLWETILSTRHTGKAVRLPGDKRCAGITKAGTRCKGRSRNGSQYCIFHDPSIDLAARRRAAGNKPKAKRRTQYHLDGVASRLTTRQGITAALDRLYNDTRAGLVAPETGQVLFNALERLLEAYNKTRAAKTSSGQDRSRAARLCRKLAKNYIAMAERHRSLGALPSDTDSSKETTPAARHAGPGRLKLHSAQPAPAATASWPPNLTARGA